MLQFGGLIGRKEKFLSDFITYKNFNHETYNI